MSARTGTAERFREVIDPGVLRALTHPVRIALIEVLVLHGPQTATESGELIGETPTTCSFHLRQLAKYGVVEEAGGGKGRRRPWKMTAIGMTLPNSGDPETVLAANALKRVLLERQMTRYEEWVENRGSYPPAWRDAASDTELVFFLTADELAALNNDLLDLLIPRFSERLTDPESRPVGALPVEFLMFSYPVAPPPQGD